MLAADPLVVAFQRVRMAPGTASKRFVQTLLAWPPERELSLRAEAYLWRIAFHYRRQLPKGLAREAADRKVSHCWTPLEGVRFECSSCKQQVWGTKSRTVNAPCPGPPVPKGTPRKRGSSGAVAEAESAMRRPISFE